ncbi:MAG: adenylyl-sulfate kinase, partial [Mycobacteriales bacterium]
MTPLELVSGRERVLAAMVARAYGATHVPNPLPAADGLPLVVELPTVAGAAAAAFAGTDATRRGLAVLFTGLSGSDKSALVCAIRDAIVEQSERSVTMLDGDVVRRMLSAELTFSRAHRELNVQRIGFIAAEIVRRGGITLCAPIALYAAVRAQVRQMVEQAHGCFVLVHVSTPME